MSIILEVDVPEPRILSPRLVAGVDGLAFDFRLGYGCLLDSVTKTLSLEPTPFSEFWGGTTAGNYARLAKAAYTITTPAKWIENHRIRTGDIWLESLGVNEAVTTAASFPANQGFFISWHTFGVKTENQIVLECGYGVYGEASGLAGPSIRVRASGRVEIWKSNALLETYDLGSLASLTGKKGKGRGLALGGEVFSLAIVPQRRNELTLIPSKGEGISHAFADLDAATPGNTITPAGRFWWYVPPRPLPGGGSEFVKASVQLAPLRYATGGAAYSEKVTLRAAPATGRVFNPVVMGEQLGTPGGAAPAVTVSLVDAATLAAFVPDGTARDVRVKCLLTGDGLATKTIWSAFMVADPILTSTSDEPFSIKRYTKGLRLDVPEKGPATLSISACGPSEMETAGLDGVTDPSDRTVRLALQSDLIGGGSATWEIFRGTIDPAETAIDWAKGKGNAATGISWKAYDREGELRYARPLHSYPLDGGSLTDNLADAQLNAGFSPARLDISADLFSYPLLPYVSLGEYQAMPPVGFSVEERLRTDLGANAPNWVTGWTPTAAGEAGYKWRARRPDTFATTPSANLYLSRADAAAAGVPGHWAHRRVIRERVSRPRPIEATDLLVVGQDRQTGRRILAQRADAAAAAPGTARAARPKNWRSRSHTVIYQDSAQISTDDLAEAAASAIWDRAHDSPEISEITTEFLVRSDTGRPLWKADILRIFEPSATTGEAPTAYQDYKIVSFSSEFNFEARGEAASLRRAVYSVRSVGEPGELLESGIEGGGGFPPLPESEGFSVLESYGTPGGPIPTEFIVSVTGVESVDPDLE